MESSGTAEAKPVGVPEKQGVNELQSQAPGCLAKLGQQFESCIVDVGLLEQKHADLQQELQRLQQPMAGAVLTLRARLLQAHRQLSHVQLEHLWLQEEARLLKRRLFTTARDCIQKQVILAAHQHEVAQSSITQEELQAQILQLTQEVSQLREAQNNRLNRLRAQPPPVRPRAYSDLTAGRRVSQDLAQYLQSGMNALETWYEPLLLTLLRRRRAGDEALRRTREFTQDLRVQLGPLREQIQTLELQRACLEDRITLIQQEREENLAQYREKLDILEEMARLLRTELQVQKKKTEELEAQRMHLEKEADAHRECVKAFSKPGHSTG